MVKISLVKKYTFKGEYVKFNYALDEKWKANQGKEDTAKKRKKFISK